MFCACPISSLYTEANETPLEERRLKLSMHYYLKTRACVDNPAHHAQLEFDPTTRGLNPPPPPPGQMRGGMTRPPTPAVGFTVETVHHVVVYSDVMPYLHAIEGEDTENPFLPYHEPALVIEWQGHSCSFLLDTNPLWYWGKWKSGPTGKRDSWSRHRPTG